jgi:hypothetical protein
VAALASLVVSCGQSGSGQSGAGEPNVAGDIPDNQAFVPFTSAGGTFTVSVPEGWARSADGAATVFSDKFNSVRIETMPAATEPHPAGADAVEIPSLRAAVPGFRGGSASLVQRKAGPAVEITYGADSAADPVTGKTIAQAVERYEFWRAGTTAVLTLAAPDGSDNVDPWRTITDSFQWKQ